MENPYYNTVKTEVEFANKALYYLQELIKYMQKNDPDELEVNQLNEASAIVQMFTDKRIQSTRDLPPAPLSHPLLSAFGPHAYPPRQKILSNTTPSPPSAYSSPPVTPMNYPYVQYPQKSDGRNDILSSYHSPFSPGPMHTPSHPHTQQTILPPSPLAQQQQQPLTPSQQQQGLLSQLLDDSMQIPEKSSKRKCPDSRVPIPTMAPYFLGDVKLHHKPTSQHQTLRSPENNNESYINSHNNHNNNNSNTTTTTTNSNNVEHVITPYHLPPAASYENQQQQQQQQQQQEQLLSIPEPSPLPMSIPPFPMKEPPKQYSLDQFVILQALGLGSYASVRLCQEKATGKYYCVKILSKAKVRSENQMEHVRNEKEILSWISHPFIMKMYTTFQDQNNLYFLLEYVSGGELFTHIKTRGRLSDATARFYAAEIILAVRYLHSLDVAHRDLKPENILLDANGHVKVSDFGFAKQVTDKTWTMCGTPEYIAPEIILSRGHDKSVDWWSLGILIYEMLVGHTPFKSTYPFETFQNILSTKVQIPDHVTPAAKDLIEKLLAHDTTRRLGSSRGKGAQEVMQHAWFSGINWNDLYEKKYRAPINPGVTWQGDTHNYATYSDVAMQAQENATLPQPPPELFQEF